MRCVDSFFDRHARGPPFYFLICRLRSVSFFLMSLSLAQPSPLLFYLILLLKPDTIMPFLCSFPFLGLVMVLDKLAGAPLLRSQSFLLSSQPPFRSHPSLHFTQIHDLLVYRSLSLQPPALPFLRLCSLPPSSKPRHALVTFHPERPNACHMRKHSRMAHERTEFTAYSSTPSPTPFWCSSPHQPSSV